jgi:hypothetical protein
MALRKYFCLRYDTEESFVCCVVHVISVYAFGVMHDVLV